MSYTSCQELGAHAITLNAYMGSDTVKPFLKDPAKGVFVLCKVRVGTMQGDGIVRRCSTCTILSARGWWVTR